MKLHCPACGAEATDKTRFCTQCGAALENRCPKCGVENPLPAKFCGECGTALAERAHASSPEPARVSEAQRRRLTVMFCDLVGSTPLSERLDPEELREVVRAYQELCANLIARFDGHIAQYLGDGLLVCFGHPVAHEDDAHRAVRTALSIVSELPQLNERLRRMVPAIAEAPLRARLGIHTGLVVIGEMGSGATREQSAIVGDTPNIAARAQELARPDTVVITSATHRLTQGFFECHDLGPCVLKGIASPMQMFEVLGESGVRSRLEATACAGLTPFVGREHELGFLLERWEEAKDRIAQVVLLNGEAGIGKSRLVLVLKERIGQEPHALLEGQCSPYHQNSALYPIIDLLQRALDWKREDSTEEKLARLEAMLAQHRFSLAEAVPLFASLFSLALPEGRYPLMAFDPQRQRQLTLQALRSWLREVSASKPLLFVIEDAHWADASTLEFLTLLVDQESSASMLTLLTFRPDFNPPWGTRPHVTALTLNQLLRKQTEALVKNVARGQGLPPEVLKQLVAKTDGIPLFVEELTKMVLESGLVREQAGHANANLPPVPVAIPATLHDSLIARLNHLATAKEIASLGATIGREFSYELLHAVSAMDETALQKELSRLVEAELLYQRGALPDATYIFKHALIQEAAYQSLLKSKRQEFHRRIAQVLEERFPETRETQPELLAYHHTEAGCPRQAIDYWQRAGQRAIERSANSEAVSHINQGLALLKCLPETPERTQQELILQLALGVPLAAIHTNPAGQEVEHAYARALELCEKIGQTPKRFVAMWGLWQVHIVRAESKKARQLGEQLLSLAQSVGDTALVVAGNRALGEALYDLGELVSARAHLAQGIALYDPRQHRSQAFLYGFDPGVFCMSCAAWTLWLLGSPTQARQKSREALALARELAHPHSLAAALVFASMIHQYYREGPQALALADEAIALATEQGFRHWVEYGSIVRGWALAQQAKGADGIALMREGLASQRVSGAEIARPYLLSLLAEAHGQEGQVEEGLAVLAEALALVRKNEERNFEAELFRLKGELLLVQAADGRSGSVTAEEAEACFHQALDVSRRQQAKSLELRAATSLSRLWQRQGKQGEARAILTEIYGWFTEGFDTADLRDAQALIESLA